MIVPMKKISIRGPRAELKNTLDILKSSGACEINNLKKGSTAAGAGAAGTAASADAAASNTHAEQLRTAIARAGAALDAVRRVSRELAAAKNPENPDARRAAKANVAAFSETDEVTYTDLKSIELSEQKVLEIIDTVEAAAAKHAELETTIARNTAAIRELVPYQALDAAFNSLADTKNTFVLAGIISAEKFEQYRSNFDLSRIVICQYDSGANNFVTVLVGHKEDYIIAHEIFSYGFERCKFNFNLSAKQKTGELLEHNKSLELQKTAAMQKCFVSAKELSLLKTYHDYLCNELDTEDVLGKVMQTENFFVISGWVVADQSEHIQTFFKKYSNEITVKLSEPTENDSVPALVRNNPVVAPYRSITNLYSAPGTKDIDPNMFVAFFYFLFFGIMIGDIGYGILMSALAVAVIFLIKPKKGTRDLVLIIGMGGVSTIIWGLIFGSFFGASTGGGDLLGKIFPSGVLNPIDNAIVFLGLTLGLGAVHIVVGLCLKFYNTLRQRQYADAFLGTVPRITLFLGAGLVVLEMLVSGLSLPKNLAMYIIAASVVLIAAGGTLHKSGFLGKFSGAFGALYSLVNYFSDILSYARLFALGLVGAVIATVANSLGGLLMPIPVVGIPLGVLVALVFHAFNLAIGLLSAYVHNARLQFIEFFSKFYTGGGKQFAPLGSGLRYTKIKGVK